MELLTSIIDLDSIQVKNSPFAPKEKATQIEALANTISALGGLVTIPVVEQISIDDYELIRGYLDYYAYLRARELSPHLPDRITVFVSTKKNQSAIRQQLDTLQAIEDTEHSLHQPTSLNQAGIDLQAKNLESFRKNSNQRLVTVIEQLKTELLEIIKTRLPQPIPPLDSFNRILEPEIAFKVQGKLEELLSSSRTKNPKKAQQIVVKLQDANKRNNHQPFQSFAEVLDILKVQRGNKSMRLISEGKMLKFISLFQPAPVIQTVESLKIEGSDILKVNNETVDKAFTQLKAELSEAIEQSLPHSVYLIEAFNRILEPEIALKMERKLEFLGGNRAKKIVSELQKLSKYKSHRPFQSFPEILEALKIQKGDKSTRLISEGKMLMLIDRWNN
jgi:hypothetical protein